MACLALTVWFDRCSLLVWSSRHYLQIKYPQGLVRVGVHKHSIREQPLFDWPIALLKTEWRKNYRMIYKHLSGKERKHCKQAGVRLCSQNHELVIWLFICCFCGSFIIISRPTKTSLKEIECLKAKPKRMLWPIITGETTQWSNRNSK